MQKCVLNVRLDNKSAIFSSVNLIQIISNKYLISHGDIGILHKNQLEICF